MCVSVNCRKNGDMRKSVGAFFAERSLLAVRIYVWNICGWTHHDQANALHTDSLLKPLDSVRALNHVFPTVKFYKSQAGKGRRC